MERDRSDTTSEGGTQGRGRLRTVDIDVGYDEAEKVYFVLSSTLPGLHVETSTFEEFVEVALDAAPDLLGGVHEGAHINFRRTVDLIPANGR